MNFGAGFAQEVECQIWKDDESFVELLLPGGGFRKNVFGDQFGPCRSHFALLSGEIKVFEVDAPAFNKCRCGCVVRLLLVEPHRGGRNSVDTSQGQCSADHLQAEWRRGPGKRPAKAPHWQADDLCVGRGQCPRTRDVVIAGDAESGSKRGIILSRIRCGTMIIRPNPLEA